MGLFLDAANEWYDLLDVSYHFVIGRKNIARQLNISFRIGDFDHLSGIQHASDVDFGLHRNEYRGVRLVPALRSGKLSDTLIEKSMEWSSISGRLSAIIGLKRILETDFEIYAFESYKLRFHSEIKAKYCVYSEELEIGVFLFLNETGRCLYCKSVFQKDNRDYRKNQARWIVLQKRKIENGTETLLYQNASYHENT